MPLEQVVESWPCAWCGEPSTKRVEIAPPVYTAIGGVRRIKTRAIEADVCDAHAAMVQRNKDEAQAEADAKASARAAARRAGKATGRS